MSWLDDLTGMQPGFWWDEPGTYTGPEKGTSAFADPVIGISWDWRIGLIYERESSKSNLLTGEVMKRQQTTTISHKTMIEWMNDMSSTGVSQYDPPPVIDPPGRKRSTWDIYRAELSAMKAEPRYFDIYSENVLTPQAQARLLEEQDPYGYKRWRAGLTDDRLWKVLLNWLRMDCMGENIECEAGTGASMGGLAIILKATLGTKFFWMFVGRNMGGIDAVNAHIDGLIRDDVAFWDSLTFLPFSNPLDFSILVPRFGLIREEGGKIFHERPVMKPMMSYADYIRAMRDTGPEKPGGCPSLPPYDIWKEINYGMCSFWPEKKWRSSVRLAIKKVKELQEEILPKRRKRRRARTLVLWPQGGRVKESEVAKVPRKRKKKPNQAQPAERASAAKAEGVWRA